MLEYLRSLKKLDNYNQETSLIEVEIMSKGDKKIRE